MRRYVVGISVIVFVSACCWYESLFVWHSSDLWNDPYHASEWSPRHLMVVTASSSSSRRRLERHKRPLVRQPTQLWYTVPSTSTSALPNHIAEAAASSIPEANLGYVLDAALGAAHTVLPENTPPEDYYENPEHFPMDDLVDIVITVEKADIETESEAAGTGKITFLRKWQPVIRSLHCIVLLAKDLPAAAEDIPALFPDWMLSYEVYTHADIATQWGEHAYLAGDGGLSMRNFGFWVSDRTVVYALDARSEPIAEPARDSFTVPSGHSKEDNIANSRADHISNQHGLLRKHLANLFTPSSPSYFNTYYDAFAAGADFPKGYPYPLRNGVHTGISHGLSIGDPGYDRMTRIAKPREGNTKMPNVTVTIPHGSLYSMAHNNIAFNRKLVGAMFFYLPSTPMDAAKETRPEEGISAEDSDLVTGWLLKTIADAVGVGVKSGAPYVTRELPVVSKENFSDRLKHALHGTRNGTFLWQDELVSWLQKIQLDFGDTNGNHNRAEGCHGRFHAPEFSDLNVAIDCAYFVLAKKIDSQLVEHFPILAHVAQSMRDWLTLWHTRNTFLPKKHPKASYASSGPLRTKAIIAKGGSSQQSSTSAPASASPSTSTCAVITIVRDEKELLPLWLRHYSRHVALHDIYILDHLTTDNSTHPSKIPKGVNYKVLYGNSFAMPVVFRSWQINKYQDRLLRFGYPCVIFSDTDEIIVPNPKRYPRGLRQYLEEFLVDDKRKFHRVHALEVGHVSWGNGTKVTQEPIFDWNNPYILAQRRTYVPDHEYNKPLLSKVPLRYRAGFHKLFTMDKVTVDDDLIMLHMRSFDKTFCMRREEQKFNLSSQMKQDEIRLGMANHWTTYNRDKASGELCRYAQSSFFGEQTSKTLYLDNTGRKKMETFGEEWKTVAI